MREASNQRETPPSVSVPVEKQPTMTSPTYPNFKTLNPIWKLSPRHNGSTLYDSYELRAVTLQLNKAIQGSKVSSPTFMRHLKSPFYHQRLDRIYKEGTKTPKRITSSQGTRVVPRGFVARLWKKVKQGLLRNKGF